MEKAERSNRTFRFVLKWFLISALVTAALFLGAMEIWMFFT